MAKSLNSDIHLNLTDVSIEPTEVLNVAPRAVRTSSDDSLDPIGTQPRSKNGTPQEPQASRGEKRPECSTSVSVELVAPPQARGATGPRTLQGRERSKYNAQKHGLFTKAIVLKTEPVKEFRALMSGLLEYWQPQGEMENELVANMATLLWRKRRVFKAERAEIESLAEYYRVSRSVVLFPLPETAEVLARMETHLSREIERCLNLLERLERRRKGQAEPPTLKVHVDS